MLRGADNWHLHIKRSVEKHWNARQFFEFVYQIPISLFYTFADHFVLRCAVIVSHFLI